MEASREQWEIEEELPAEGNNAKFTWMWNQGLDLGKKALMTGFVISSVPFVLPPLVVMSAIGAAVSLPFGIVFASYVCTEKVMSMLLPIPAPPLATEYDECYGGGEVIEPEEMELVDLKAKEGDLVADKDDQKLVGGKENEQEGIVDDKEQREDVGEYLEDVKVSDVQEDGHKESIVEEDKKPLDDDKETQEPAAIKDDPEQMEPEATEDDKEPLSELNVGNKGAKLEKEKESVVEENEEPSDATNIKPEGVVEEGGKKEPIIEENEESLKDDRQQLQPFATVGLREGETKESELEENEESWETGGTNIVGGRNEERREPSMEQNRASLKEQDVKIEHVSEEREEPVIEEEKEPSVKIESYNEHNSTKDENDAEKSSLEVHHVVVIEEEEENGEVIAATEVLILVDERGGGVAGDEKGINGTKVGEVSNGKMAGFVQERTGNLDAGSNMKKHDDEVVVAEENRKNVSEMEEREKTLEESNGDVENGTDSIKMNKAIPSNENEGQKEEDVKLEEIDGEEANRTDGADKNMKSVAEETPVEQVSENFKDKKAGENADSSEITSAGGTAAESSNEECCYREDKLWEQIDAMRTIVGYKAQPHPACIDELKALYVFTGVEPPSSFRDPADLPEVYDKLRFLMSVVGVK